MNPAPPVTMTLMLTPPPLVDDPPGRCYSS
jgi:hypothetical protein